ncbi:MAG: DUF2779 domain-containing protein [Fimbriimonadaceae bacterium]
MTELNRAELLTKTEFIRGLDCERRLWFDRFRQDLKPPLSLPIRERIEVGSAIGKLAQQRYRSGVAVSGTYGDHEEAARLTQELIDSGADCIFEATFIVGGHLVRVDVLSKGNSGWILDEVKSSSVKEPDKLDEDKVLDLAFQVYTLKEAGLNIEQARLVLVDTSYVWDGGTYHPEMMLGVVDLTERCEELRPQVEERSKRLQDVLKATEQPEVEINTHCKKCDYFEACHEGRPYDVIHLPRMNEKSVRELRALGYDFISQIPESHKLTDPRRRMRDVVVSGKPYIGDGLADALSAVKFPACFIDYESSNPAFPMYEGTRPYQQVCFQWSAHVLESETATPVHYEFLPTDATDPRAEFCKTLWEVVRDCDSIVYYTGFELTQVRNMENEGVPIAAELVAALELRTVDLEKVVREYVCFSEFRGRTSLKVVLPVLVPSMSYKNMQIGDGLAAACGYRRMVLAETDRGESGALREALLAYCKQDTLAMVEIYRALQLLGLKNA